jgi:hypothetical protein
VKLEGEEFVLTAPPSVTENVGLIVVSPSAVV